VHEFAFKDPQIEVLSDSNRRDAILARLATAGFRPLLASPPIEQTTSVPLLVDLNASGLVDHLTGATLSGLTADRPIVLLGALPKGALPAKNQVHISSLDMIATLSARLDLRRRSLLRENERDLREQTARSFGSPLYFEGRAEAASTPKVLYVGPIGARFLPLSKGLSSRGVEVVASITLQTAAMHIAAEQFRLLIVDQKEDASDVETLVKGQGDLPVYLVGQGADRIFDGTIDLDGDSETACDFIAERAKSVPLCTRLSRVRLGATSHDPLTGLYSEAFLRAHLPRQMEACAQFETPLTLLHLRCRDGEFSSSDLVHMASLYVSNLRETDLLARLNHSSFLAVLRDTPYAGAAKLGVRLTEVIGQDPKLGPNVAHRIVWRAVERRGSFTPEGLISSALQGPYTRTVAA